MLKILRIKKFPLYDIFQGEGWENWSRYLFIKGHLKLISGIPLSIKEIREVKAKLETK